MKSELSKDVREEYKRLIQPESPGFILNLMRFLLICYFKGILHGKAFRITLIMLVFNFVSIILELENILSSNLSSCISDFTYII